MTAALRLSYNQNNMLKPVKTTIQAIFKNRPARIISCCLIWPVAKTIAFGGVATGSIKAHEAAMAINTDRITGDMPNASATEANTGISKAALAVLLANSVRNTTNVAITRIIINIPI